MQNRKTNLLLNNTAVSFLSWTSIERSKNEALQGYYISSISAHLSLQFQLMRINIVEIVFKFESAYVIQEPTNI